MTETQGQLPGSGQTSVGDPRPAELEARSDERRKIGRRLHQGILQDLTVAGLRLKAIEDQATAPSMAAIAEFAAWLRERQGDLRVYVSSLEQGLGGNALDAELATLADSLAAQHQCQVSVDGRVQTMVFPMAISEAMVRAIRGILPILADPLGARAITIAPEAGTAATLRITHDGGHLRDHAEPLAAVRQSAGRNGASLHVETRPATETLILDWAN